MVLDLRRIVNAPGERMDFQFDLDLSNVDFGGVFPIQNPVVVTGEVRNTAGMLTLTFEASTVLKSICDRCLAAFDQPKSIQREYLLSTEPTEDDGVISLDHLSLDMAELSRTEFILAMDTKTLCSEDCKGICPGCGVNLNQGKCVCKKTGDPRLAALSELLKNMDDDS